MAYTPQSNQYDNTPNSTAIFDIATSYEGNQLGSASIGGTGSLVNRSVASSILYYYYAKFPFDQMTQLIGSLETTPTGYKEFFEAESLFDFEASGLTDAGNVDTDYVNTSGAYVADPTSGFHVAAADKDIFRPYSEIRYETSSGWQHAYVTAITLDAATTGYVLSIQSLDGSNLVAAASATATVQHVTTNLPQDLDYDENPRQTQPSSETSYCENPRADIQMTRKQIQTNVNGGTVVDLIAHFEKQLAENFRRDRETKFLNGSGETQIITLASGDKVYFSNGIYNQIKDQNLHTSDLKTSGVFDADKFKNAIHNFTLYNFAAESGGTQEKDLYVDANMQDYFDRAWEGSERFLGGQVTTEFVAGISVTRFAKTGVLMDIFSVPNWSAMHPIVNGQIRGGSAPRGVGLLIPMTPDNVVRIQQDGMGARQIMWKDNEGSRLTKGQMESVEGLHIRQKQLCAVFEEVAE